jgi:hypothetical protein
MADIDLSDDAMDDMFADRLDDIMVVRLTAPDDEIARCLRGMDRETKVARGRPSNGHPSNPRKRR